MTKWKHKLNLSSFYHDSTLSIAKKGKLMAIYIGRLPIDKIDTYIGDDFEDIAAQFNECTVEEEFNELMSQLYDMADRYDIWISTK